MEVSLTWWNLTQGDTAYFYLRRRLRLNVLGTFEENPGGELIVGGGVTNQGTLRLLGDAQLNIGGTFINNGVLDIMTWHGVLPAGFTNHGVLLDRSAIKVESCAAKGGNFDLTIMGYPSHTYQLQGSSALTPWTWVNIGSSQAGAGKILDFADSMGDGVEKFYRVAVY